MKDNDVCTHGVVTIPKKSVKSWQLSEKFSMVMDMTMLMYLVLAE